MTATPPGPGDHHLESEIPNEQDNRAGTGQITSCETGVVELVEADKNPADVIFTRLSIDRLPCTPVLRDRSNDHEGARNRQQ